MDVGFVLFLASWGVLQWGPMGFNGVQQTDKNWAKSEEPGNPETLHKSGQGLIKMGFW